MADNFSSDNPIIRNFITKCIKDEFPNIPEYINYDLFKKHMISEIFKYLKMSLEEKDDTLMTDWLFVFNSDSIYICGTYAECCENVTINIPDEIIELYKNNVGKYDESIHNTDESIHNTNEINDVRKNIIKKYTGLGFTLILPKE